jgi:hypothetical protein
MDIAAPVNRRGTGRIRYGQRVCQRSDTARLREGAPGMDKSTVSQAFGEVLTLRGTGLGEQRM